MDGTQVLRIIVVDEQLTFAEAVGARLGIENDLHVVAAVDAVEHLWPLLETGSVDLVLLGLAEGVGRDDGRGLAAIRRLAGRDPRVRVVVMASRTESAMVAEAIEARISGWVPKDLGIDRLLETVRGVRQDETWIPAHVLTGVLNVLVEGNRRSTQHASVLSRLTPREMDVLQCIVDGLGRQEMADRLRLSPNTVRTHVQHVLRKLGVHSTLTAAAVARTLGLERRENPMLPTRPHTDLHLPGQSRSSLGTSPIT